MKAKRLSIYHAIEVATNSGTKLVIVTTTSLTKLVDEDVDNNVMIYGWDVEIIKGECDNPEDTMIIRIYVIGTIRSVINNVLLAIYHATRLIIIDGWITIHYTLKVLNWLTD